MMLNRFVSKMTDKCLPFFKPFSYLLLNLSTPRLLTSLSLGDLLYVYCDTYSSNEPISTYHNYGIQYNQSFNSICNENSSTWITTIVFSFYIISSNVLSLVSPWTCFDLHNFLFHTWILMEANNHLFAHADKC